MSDGQEITDDTDPLDRGNAQVALQTTICSDWNGFIDGLWNIFEHVNLSEKTLTVTTTLYSISGEEQSLQMFTVQPGAQHDVLIHDMEGRIRNSYGKVCSRHDGAPGDLDGGMVFYKSAPGGGFEFAFSMPMSNGKRGAQYVPFNTFHPSYRMEDQQNIVANWIELVNESPKRAAGVLRYFGMDGGLLAEEAVQLEAGARRDFSAHQFGRDRVGHVAWMPSDPSVDIQLRNVRYLYDNPSGADGFDTAFQLDGLYGSGGLLAVPLDTRGGSAILEVTNTLSEAAPVHVLLYDADGTLRSERRLTVAARATFHLMTEAEDLLGPNRRGMAVVRGTKRASLIAVAMHYLRESGKVSYMYGIPAVAPLGTVLRGTYNTYLGQESELVLLNPNERSANATVSMTRSNGDRVRGVARAKAEPILQGDSVRVPAFGTVVQNLNEFERPNEYGVVTVHSPRRNGLVAWVLRRRGAEYLIPRPVRQ
ncbi:MAG: hypothetical protein KDD69_03160 [Bdellovibrionales bacterium]|nr:hypothetical protein [Bdellovibrionales bacterium]